MSIHHHHTIAIINILMIIISIVIIDVFGTCCRGSWPMMPASGDQGCRPMLLANGDIGAALWCCPMLLSSLLCYGVIYTPSDLRALLSVHVELLCSDACDFRVRFKGAPKTFLV
jgi:hypothetical protein